MFLPNNICCFNMCLIKKITFHCGKFALGFRHTCDSLTATMMNYIDITTTMVPVQMLQLMLLYMLDDGELSADNLTTPNSNFFPTLDQFRNSHFNSWVELFLINCNLSCMILVFMIHFSLVLKRHHNAETALLRVQPYFNC